MKLVMGLLGLLNAIACLYFLIWQQDVDFATFHLILAFWNSYDYNNLS